MANRKLTVLIFGGFVTAVAAAFYPIFFHPLTHTDDYKQIQKVNRAAINQADVQPVVQGCTTPVLEAQYPAQLGGFSTQTRLTGVKIWSDPFKSK